jgi:molecular chaperone GrpE
VVGRKQAESPAEAAAEAAEWKEKYTRLYAERENERKRLERNYANRLDREKDQLLQELLPLADNLERALAHASEQEVELQRGVDLTLRAFTETLAKHGVTPIEAKGQQFDPHLHEAVGTLRHPTLHPGTIVDVVETGYSVEGRLLRPARVLVVA